MKIVVIGGTGLIGSKTVSNLKVRGHDVVAAAPATGVDTITGEGLAAVFEAADIVIDLANSPSFEDTAAMEFFQTSGRNIFAAEQKAGIHHHVALSVVGTDRLLDCGYFRAKQAQEDLIRASGIPFTIIRSTQFFEFMGAIARASTRGDKVYLSHMPIQPIISDDVAEAVADIALDMPLNGLTEIAGPDREPLDEMVARLLRIAKDPRQVVIDAHEPYFGVVLDDRSLIPSDGARISTTHFDTYLAHGVFRL
jgi:uncharacterized protein YbjT (DUF2867 family)